MRNEKMERHMTMEHLAGLAASLDISGGRVIV
jgi:hypothetical protein